MSPIELRLYQEMHKEGLSPEPQLCIRGYFVDFAFADVKVAVEADGAAYHGEERRQHDRERDRVLNRAGWTIKHFPGSMIQHEPGNCVNVVKQEIGSRRRRLAERSRQEEQERVRRNEVIVGPFKKLVRLLRGR